jgi:hypothetical protein
LAGYFFPVTFTFCNTVPGNKISTLQSSISHHDNKSAPNNIHNTPIITTRLHSRRRTTHPHHNLEFLFPAPITIFTYSRIFNTHLALQRRNFTLHDMSTNPPTPTDLEVIKGGKRPGFSRREGSRDAKYYVTLYPGIDHEIQCPFFVVRRMEQETWLPVLHIGHRYRLGVYEGEKIKGWWWGTVDDVLIGDEEPDGRVEPIGGEVPIDICADPVDLEVREA